MSVRLTLSRCPNCGAPLDVQPGRTVAICIFCNASLRVQRSATAEMPAALAPTEVAAEDIERVKQLLLDGQRDEAVAHYARVAQVSSAEAETAVEGIYLSSYWELTKHVPINAFGFLLYFVLTSIGAVPAAIAAVYAGESPGLWVVVVLGVLFALWQIRSFLRHLRSTLVSAFGATGRGKVLKCAVVRAVPERGGAIVVVVFEVTPDRGGVPFVDQETLMVGEKSLTKLTVGNTIRVRFDGSHTLVFPVTPITVL